MYDWWTQRVLADDRRRDLLREVQKERIARQFKLQGPPQITGCCDFIAADSDVAEDTEKVA